jgi:hypothetical protein
VRHRGRAAVVRGMRECRSIRWLRPPQRSLAFLAFDSRVDAQFVGLRGLPRHVRRLLFQADDVELDLEVTPASDDVSLAGQITAGQDEPNGGVLRLSTANDERTARLSGSGEFRLDNLARGAYRLEIALPGRVVEVPVLPL